MSRTLKALSVASIVAMYLVLVMGSLVTNSGSAEGCGRSWPLCHGRWLPDLDYHAIIELSHRAVSGIAGILVVATAFWAWLALPRRRLVTGLAVTAVGFLVIQAALGAAAVLWPQPKLVLAAHFGISLVSFASVLLLGILVLRTGPRRPGGAAPADPRLARWVWYVTLFTFIVVYLGAYVRHIGAGMACVGWPLCNGELVPPVRGPVGASFLHRLGAALLFVMVVRLVALAHTARAGRPDLLRGAYAALALLVAQVASGGMMATGFYNLGVQMLHSSTLTAYFGVLSYLCLQVLPGAGHLPPDPERRAGSPAPA